MKAALFFVKLFFLFNLFASSAICESAYFFKPNTHKEINKKMLDKVLNDLKLTINEEKTKLCRKRLNSTQTFQDYILFAKSRAHFDNCAFQRSINYINKLMVQNKSFADKYLRRVKNGGDQKELDLLRRKIMVNAGKILHTIQDFYSHSNFVELMEEKHPNIEDVPLVHVWEKKGQEQIIKLQKESNLISGKAWWVFPKRCPKKSPSHGKLAKDSLKFDMGKRMTIWTNKETEKTINGFDAAYSFAEESSYQFLLHIFNTYPLLKDYCGNVDIPT